MSGVGSTEPPESGGAGFAGARAGSVLPEDARALYDYNATDIATEAELSSRVPDLPQAELDYWFLDQAINARGVHVDAEGIEACIAIIEQAHEQYNLELFLQSIWS